MQIFFSIIPSKKGKRVNMQKRLYIYLASTLLSSSLLAFDAQITAENLNVRAIPNVHGKIVGSVHKDETYHILTKHNGWYKIAPQQWIFAKHTKELGSTPEYTRYVAPTLYKKKSVKNVLKKEEIPVVMHKFGDKPDKSIRDDSIDADFMAGVGVKYVMWEAASTAGGNGDSKDLATVDYTISNSMYKSAQLEGHYKDTKFALSYLKNEVEKSNEQLHKASEILSLFVDFNNLISDNLTLRIKMTSGNIVGKAVFHYKQDSTITSLREDGYTEPFSSTMQRYALYVIPRTGPWSLFGLGFEYSDYAIPTAVDYSRNSQNSDTAAFVDLDPKFHIQSYKLHLLLDTTGYIRKNYRNFSGWMSEGFLGVGFDKRDLSAKRTKEVKALIEEKTGESHPVAGTSYGLSLDSKIFIGYLYQRRFSATKGLGFSTTFGYDIRASYNGGMKSTSDSVSNTYQIGTRRYDLWHGPAVQLNIIF